MPLQDKYTAQVDLLIRCLPAIAGIPEFALKGGTALNLFVHDMPRLSVDIDLAYLPITDRDTALSDIDEQLSKIASEIRRTIPDVQNEHAEGGAPKLLVATPKARIKIEPSPVIRGSLVPPVMSDLCPSAQEASELFVQMQRLDAADLYGGKLCAALDRQHPRDLFDLMALQAAGEIPDAIRQAFVAYIAGHNRPMAELLSPKRQPIDEVFRNQFSGMTEHPVDLADLEAARERLFQWVGTALTENERRFLLSVKRGEPEWGRLPFEDLEYWPAIQWKLHNIRRMTALKHEQALARLREVLAF